jgi:hypothetical protein
VGVLPTASTVVGGGFFCPLGDGGPAHLACLGQPRDVTVGPNGTLYIGDGPYVRRVGPDGIMNTVAGGGTSTGDGGPATAARLWRVEEVAVDRDGGFYIADWADQRIRYVRPDGIISTVAGTGSTGFSADGGAPGEVDDWLSARRGARARRHAVLR